MVLVSHKSRAGHHHVGLSVASLFFKICRLSLELLPIRPSQQGANLSRGLEIESVVILAIFAASWSVPVFECQDLSAHLF